MYEINSYHFNAETFGEYKKWVIAEVVPFLRANLDLVGFWLDNIEAPELGGTQLVEHPLGSVNSMWIVRWDSMEERNRKYEEVFGCEEWKRIKANLPDPDGYLQYETRFAEGY
jgi:hypothetical protein